MKDKLTKDEIEDILIVLKVGLATLNTSTFSDKQKVKDFIDKGIILKLIDNLI